MKLTIKHITFGLFLTGVLFACSGSKKNKCNTCPKWGHYSQNPNLIKI